MSWANAEIKSTHRLWESWQIKILTNKIVTCWYSEIIIKESSKLYITFVLYFLVIMLRLPYWFDKKKLELCLTVLLKINDVDNSLYQLLAYFLAQDFVYSSESLAYIDPFVADLPILYPLETVGNQKVSSVFGGYKMEIMARKGLTKLIIARWGPALKNSFLLACCFMRRNMNAMNTNIACVLIRNL